VSFENFDEWYVAMMDEISQSQPCKQPVTLNSSNAQQTIGLLEHIGQSSKSKINSNIDHKNVNGILDAIVQIKIDNDET
jgi:hypothetical protein